MPSLPLTRIGYLGPPGTFTHQAALRFAKDLTSTLDAATNAQHDDNTAKPTTSFCAQSQNLDNTLANIDLLPFDNVGQVFAALDKGEIQFGVAAIDNTVEGPVFATIDGLLQHPGVIAINDTWLPVQFDAYALAETTSFQVAVAHSHALAQVSNAIGHYGVKQQAAASNGAALVDLAPGQIAFGPPGYERDGVVKIAENVGDYPDTKTQFVLLTNQKNPESTLSFRAQQTPSFCAQSQNLELTSNAVNQTMLAITPGATGPGVLARITASFANQNLNLSALFSRPIKGVAGQYVFIVTVDAGPKAEPLTQVIDELAAASDQVRILGAW